MTAIIKAPASTIQVLNQAAALIAGTVVNAQQENLSLAVAQATSHWKIRLANKKVPRVPTDEETVEFQKRVAANIESSRGRKLVLASKEDRRARKAAILEKANALGIKFFHHREIEDDFVGQFYGLRPEVSTLGGATVAFKYTLADNVLGMDFAVAFCRDDENFDPIIGMEESVKKFEANVICNTEITHDRFGPVKREKLTHQYKSYENKTTVHVTPSA